MQLTDVQQQAVKCWVQEGCGLSEIQSRLAGEFKIAMTYMDVRFLLIDLKLEVKEAAQKKTAPVDLKAAPQPGADAVGDEEIGGGPLPPSNVSVDVDRITSAGAVASGTVSFSDGTKGRWALDQLGRLALDTGKKKYRPSPEDVEAFQAILSRKLQSQGY